MLRHPLLLAVLLVSFNLLAGDKGHHWSYRGPQGPDHWGEIAPAFAACKAGRKQSPIDLSGAQRGPASAEPLQFKYKPSAYRIIDNGHTIQANFDPGSRVIVRGQEYELLQIHFHAKSEHTVDQKHFPLELHLVHKDADGRLAVVGVFFKQGQHNPVLETLFRNLPPKPGAEFAVRGVTLDVSELLPQDRTYFHYTGSLTTPPCSEGVNWNVFAAPIEASRKQLLDFESLYSANYRPVQPRHGRVPASF